MRALLAWALRHPTRAAIVSGIAIALLAGYISFPRSAEVERVSEVLQGGRLLQGAEATRLEEEYRSLLDARPASVVTVSREEFEARGLSVTHAYPEPGGGARGVTIRYLGKASSDASTIYLTERRLFAGPWWSPERIVYRAVKAEVDQIGRVVRLTFERDLEGLVALLVLDLIIGVVYGAVIGMILGVLGAQDLTLPRGSQKKPAPLPAPSRETPLQL